MRRQPHKFNTKRKLSPPPATEEEKNNLKRLAAAAQYDGNPEHKENPGDFNLSPPSKPRKDKSLCDGVKIFEKKKAYSS